MTVWSNPFWNSADSVKPPMSGTESSPIRPEADPFAQARRHMVDVQLRARDITDPDVLKVMGRIARERFAPADMQDRAYADYPLPIGWGQTISQPYIVALMTQLARPSPQSRALEIGVGSGYQTVILAALCHSVYGMEIVQPLADAARERLSSMGVSNVSIRYGDGYRGWPEQSPFDIILVAAAPERVPRSLVDQLAIGGRLVIPVGRNDQDLLLIEKVADGSLTRRTIIPVQFVPMTREAEGQAGHIRDTPS